MSHTTDVLEERIRELEDEITYNKKIYDTHVEMIMEKNRKLEAIRKLSQRWEGRIFLNTIAGAGAKHAINECIKELLEVVGE